MGVNRLYKSAGAREQVLYALESTAKPPESRIYADSQQNPLTGYPLPDRKRHGKTIRLKAGSDVLQLHHRLHMRSLGKKIKAFNISDLIVAFGHKPLKVPGESGGITADVKDAVRADLVAQLADKPFIHAGPRRIGEDGPPGLI